MLDLMNLVVKIYYVRFFFTKIKIIYKNKIETYKSRSLGGGGELKQIPEACIIKYFLDIHEYVNNSKVMLLFLMLFYLILKCKRFQVHGYCGNAGVVVSCVTKDGPPYYPHPHNLVGKTCKSGVCYKPFNNSEMICR